MLHTLTTSPFKTDLTAIVRFFAAGDDVLLLQDAVLAAIEGTRALEILLQAPISLYVLQEDVVARGLSAQISASTATVSYTDFVALTVKNPQQMTW
ncbi:sulfurtransferase complex subunit TusB [Erwinia sp.]|uniref:sulfurtransferase complex subunit TusB n=1 Tax=Erwinia citreus TaxID=558 RepID=UPI003C78406D